MRYLAVLIMLFAASVYLQRADPASGNFTAAMQRGTVETSVLPAQ